MSEVDTQTTQKLLKDLHAIYARALKEKNFSVALKAKEMECKIKGVLRAKNHKFIESYQDLTVVELENIINSLDKSCH